MLRAVADTHAIIWYLYDDSRLSDTAKRVFEDAAAAGEQVGFSAITLVEIIYLSEKGRIDLTTFQRLQNALEGETTVLVEVPFDGEVARAMLDVERDQVPDMPDRIIAATAVKLGVPLISRDAKIRLSSVPTIW